MFDDNKPGNLPIGNQPDDPFAKIDGGTGYNPAPATPISPTSSIYSNSPSAAKSGPSGNSTFGLPEQEIHTMPDKFLTPIEKKSHAALVIIICLVVMLIGAGAAAFFFRDNVTNFLASQFGSQVELNTNANSNFNSNELASNTNLNEDINSNINSANLNENISANLNENVNTNTNINTNINANIDVNGGNINLDAISSSIDSDSDLLTDSEEALYQSDINQPDSDQDGYLDGQELANFYDPTQIGLKLTDSAALVRRYDNSFYGYTLYYPSAWQASDVGGSGQEVIFNSALGEFIGVSAQENINNLSALDWYLQNMELADPSQIQRITISQTEAVRSLDGFSLYLNGAFGGKNYIYTISYNIGNKSEAAYKTTFQMMQKSFAFIPTF